MVDDELRTSVSGIWALSDRNGKGAFSHTSCNDFEIVQQIFLMTIAAVSATAFPPMSFISIHPSAVPV